MKIIDIQRYFGYYSTVRVRGVKRMPEFRRLSILYTWPLEKEIY